MIAIAARLLIAAAVALAGAAAIALAAGDEDRSTPPVSGAATDAWASLRPSPLRRTEVGGARIGRYVYVVGGFVPEGGATRRMLRYDIESNRWKRVRSLPIAVHHPGAVAYRGRLYVHGGLRTDAAGPSTATARLYRYDPRRNRWKRLRSGRVPRLAHGFEEIDGHLYAAGGNNESGDLRSVEVYDPERDRWRRGRGMPTARHHVGAAVLDDRLYVVAGRNDGENIDVVERYDPEAGRRGRWSELEPIGIERSGFAAVAAAGTIVAFGGEELGGGSTIAPVERYDPESDSWSRLPRMSTPRHGLAGVARGNRIYAIEGGPQPGLAYSSANEFLDLP